MKGVVHSDKTTKSLTPESAAHLVVVLWSFYSEFSAHVIANISDN